MKFKVFFMTKHSVSVNSYVLTIFGVQSEFDENTSNQSTKDFHLPHRLKNSFRPSPFIIELHLISSSASSSFICKIYFNSRQRHKTNHFMPTIQLFYLTSKLNLFSSTQAHKGQKASHMADNFSLSWKKLEKLKKKCKLFVQALLYTRMGFKTCQL